MHTPANSPDSESAIRGDDQRSIIFVAYHFFPSPEVGARRMTALARHLAAQGRAVAVVSAFAGLETGGTGSSARAALAAYDIEHVPDRRSLIDTVLVTGKKWLRGLASRWPRSARLEPERADSFGGRHRQSQSAFHRVLFGILWVIDPKKTWSRRAGRRLRRLASRHPDGVIVVSSPPASTLLFTVLAARGLKRPVIVDLRDPITDSGIADQDRSRKRRWETRVLLERYVISRADAVVTTTPGLRDRLRARYPAQAARISCVFNGFDGEPAPAKADTGHRLTIVFAGELYLNRNPFPFLEAVDRLLTQGTVDESRIRVVFAGQCDFHGGVSVHAWSSTRPCGRVLTILPALDAARLRQIYEDSTLLLNFAEGQPIQVPAKTFELLSLGREVLVACEPDSDTSKVVCGIDGVYCVRMCETQRLDDLLRSFYRRHVEEGRMSPPTADAVRQFSRAIQNERYGALIERVRVRRGSTTVDGGIHGN